MPDPDRPATPRATGAAIAELFDAARCGDIELARRAIATGVDVDMRDGRGQTALMIATLAGEAEVARVLLQTGADPNLKDGTVQSAYLLATSEIGNDPTLLTLLLSHGADVHSLDWWHGTGLIRAAERGYDRIVEVLLSTDINVNHINRIGYTALHEAVVLGSGGPEHQRTVALLLSAGADRSIRDGHGRTALQSAQRAGFAELVQLLDS